MFLVTSHGSHMNMENQMHPLQVYSKLKLRDGTSQATWMHLRIFTFLIVVSIFVYYCFQTETLWTSTNNLMVNTYVKDAYCDARRWLPLELNACVKIFVSYFQLYSHEESEVEQIYAEIENKLNKEEVKSTWV